MENKETFLESINPLIKANKEGYNQAITDFKKMIDEISNIGIQVSKIDLKQKISEIKHGK